MSVRWRDCPPDCRITPFACFADIRNNDIAVVCGSRIADAVGDLVKCRGSAIDRQIILCHIDSGIFRINANGVGAIGEINIIVFNDKIAELSASSGGRAAEDDSVNSVTAHAGSGNGQCIVCNIELSTARTVGTIAAEDDCRIILINSGRSRIFFQRDCVSGNIYRPRCTFGKLDAASLKSGKCIVRNIANTGEIVQVHSMMCSAEDLITGNGKVLCRFHTNDISGAGSFIRIACIKGIVTDSNIFNICTLHINDGSGIACGNCPLIYAEVKPFHRHVALGNFDSTVQSDILVKLLYDDASGNACNRDNAFKSAAVWIQIGRYIKCHDCICRDLPVGGSRGYSLLNVVDPACIGVLNGLSKRVPSFFCSNEIIYVRHIFYSMLWF